MAAQRHLCGVLPVRAFYALPYAMGAIPGYYQTLSVLSMVLIPLTLAYAIVRYRLMDVDILFRRGYAYTLATVCVLAAFYGIIFSLGTLVSKKFTDQRPWRTPSNMTAVVMLTAAFLFQPIRDWIQEWLDKLFLQRPLRLPPHPGGIRPRAWFADRSGHACWRRWASGC